MVAGVRALETGATLLWQAGFDSRSNGAGPPTPVPFHRATVRWRNPCARRCSTAWTNTSRTARRRACSWAGDGFGGAAGVGTRGRAGKESARPDDWLRRRGVRRNRSRPPHRRALWRAAHAPAPGPRSAPARGSTITCPRSTNRACTGFRCSRCAGSRGRRGSTVALAGVGWANSSAIRPCTCAVETDDTMEPAAGFMRALFELDISRRDADPVTVDAGGFPFASADLARRVCRSSAVSTPPRKRARWWRASPIPTGCADPARGMARHARRRDQRSWNTAALLRDQLLRQAEAIRPRARVGSAAAVCGCAGGG